MKIIWASLFLWHLTLTSFGQETARKNALTLSFGPSSIVRQDLIFSPFVHKDFSLLNVGLEYIREAKSFQKISINYANFNPMVAEPYEFTFHGEPYTAFPHSMNFIDLDYQFGKTVNAIHDGQLTLGGHFFTDIQVMNYAYGRISSFGYFASLGLGVFGTYKVPINEKSRIQSTIRLPLVAWLARSPYLVNDDEFINNTSSHSGIKTFMALLGDGQLASWNKIQTIDFEAKYAFDLNHRWGFGAAYLFEFFHVSQPRKLLSFRNSLNFSTSFKF
jgi:hypothetical protein